MTLKVVLNHLCLILVNKVAPQAVGLIEPFPHEIITSKYPMIDSFKAEEIKKDSCG